MNFKKVFISSIMMLTLGTSNCLSMESDKTKNNDLTHVRSLDDKVKFDIEKINIPVQCCRCGIKDELFVVLCGEKAFKTIGSKKKVTPKCVTNIKYLCYSLSSVFGVKVKDGSSHIFNLKYLDHLLCGSCVLDVVKNQMSCPKCPSKSRLDAVSVSKILKGKKSDIYVLFSDRCEKKALGFLLANLIVQEERLKLSLNDRSVLDDILKEDDGKNNIDK